MLYFMNPVIIAEKIKQITAQRASLIKAGYTTIAGIAVSIKACGTKPYSLLFKNTFSRNGS